MGNTKSIALINKYREQIMGVAALCIIVFHTWYRLAVPETSPKLLYYAELAVTKLGYIFPAVRHRAELCHSKVQHKAIPAAQIQASRLSGADSRGGQGDHGRLELS